MENLKEILDSINKHTSDERANFIPNKSIARGNVTMKDGRNITVWIVNREYAHQGDSTYGTFVTSKNTRWGQILTSKFKGDEFCIGRDNKDRPVRLEFTINNSASYYNSSVLENLKIGISSEATWRYFKNLKSAYDAIKSGLDELLEIKRKEELARKAIEEAKEQKKRKEQEEELARLEARSKEVQKDLLDALEKYKNASSFVRKQASLRINPVIDEAQNAVKFSHIYDGVCVVVDGGPGTGKTTTMIQRLKYLISRIELEDNMLNNPDISISDDQFKVILNNGGDWIFFSPTELLRLYLRDAMNEEGLQDTENRTAVWTKYLRKILRDNYHLIGNDCPFGGSSEEKPLFLKDERQLIRDVNAFFVSQIVAEIKRMTDIDSSKYSWRSIGAQMNKNAEKLDAVNDFASLIKYLISLGSIRRTTVAGFNEVDSFMASYREGLSSLTGKLIAQIQDDNELYSELRSIVNKNTQTVIDEEDVDDEEEVIDSFAEDKIKIARRVRSMLRAVAVCKLDENSKLVGINKEFYEKTKHLIQDDSLRAIGELALFDKRIRPLIEKPDNFIFNRIPRLYKAYRKMLVAADSPSWDRIILTEEVSPEKRNRPLHPQEQALLLGIINNIAKKIYLASARVFESCEHKYIEAYRDVIKPVIGVDEATDYSIVDFYAIASLGHYTVSSFTLAGDIMQGLTVNGIKDWTDLYDDDIFSEMDINPLVTSYRQSPALLELAQRLYKKQIGFPAPYKSYLEGTKEPVPKPLWFESDSDMEKAEWLINRILEVKAKYTFVPSIAIFVSDSKSAAQLTENLLSFETLQDEGIDVADCSRGDTLSSKDTIRIFPIKLVKGMEFEVAFFHDIDNLQSELVERFLYVGLSRAAFFLGVTSSPKCNLLAPVRMLFKEGDWRQI